jgi:hypothetical protein
VRRLLLPVGLIALLLGVFQLSRVSAGWRFTVSDSPGVLLYATGFESEDDAWQEAEGRLSAQIEDGVVRLDVGSANSNVYAPLRWHFTDFDFTVDAQATGGAESNGFGVIFRLTDLDNYYYFLIGSDGYYQLTRVQDGVAEEMSQWIFSQAIRAGIGETNTIRVVGVGDQFRFYVNDQPMAMCIPDNPDARSTYNDITGECIEGQMLETVTDASIPDGRLGVIATSLDEPDTVVEFDNAVVYSPTEMNNVELDQ